MKIVFPFYSGDVWLILKHLDWILELEGQPLGYHAVLACDNKTDMRPVFDKAKKIFAKVGYLTYERAHHNGKVMEKWPWQQNNSFANTARAMMRQNDCWLWCETDCTVLKKGWAQALETEYRQGKKPFGGHWNPSTNIFNGVAVYPANVARYCVKALMASIVVDEARLYQPPWDAYMSKDVFPMLHQMNSVMQHLWSLPDDHEKAPTFPTQEAVNKWIRPEVYIFHRCKDGTLIDRMRERRANLEGCVGKDLVHPREEVVVVPSQETAPAVAQPPEPVPEPTPEVPPAPPPEIAPEPAPAPVRKRKRLRMRLSPKRKNKNIR